MRFRHCLLLLSSLFLRAAWAFRNVTVDDTDPAISYQGKWEDTPFDPLNHGGTHKVTGDSTDTASFTFTGTGIYFFSPLWPFRVTTYVQLDEYDPVLLDLQDHDSPYRDNGPETVSSEVVWAMTGLANVEHHLRISVGPGEDLAVVDYLIYTVPETNDPTRPPSSSAATNTHRTLPIASPTGSPSSSGDDDGVARGLPIAIGIVCSAVGLFLIFAGWWYWRRRKRLAAEADAAEQEAGETPGYGGEMGEASASGTGSGNKRRYPRTYLFGSGIATAGSLSNATPVGTGRGRRSGGKSGRRKQPTVPPPTRKSAATRMKSPLSAIPEAGHDMDNMTMVGHGGGGGGGLPPSLLQSSLAMRGNTSLDTPKEELEEDDWITSGVGHGSTGAASGHVHGTATKSSGARSRSPGKREEG